MLQAGRSPVRVPDEVDFFNLPNPSSRTELGPKSGRLVRLTTLPPSMTRMFENVGTSNSLNPKGLRDLYRVIFTFISHYVSNIRPVSTPCSPKLSLPFIFSYESLFASLIFCIRTTYPANIILLYSFALLFG
jgi:hypothetical protein